MEKQQQRIFYCTVCDWNLVDMDDPKTGKVYSVWGALLGADNSRSATVLVCVCPSCKVKDALAPVKAFERSEDQNGDEQVR